MAAFGKLLQQLIKATGKSVRAWCESAGTSQGQVSNVIAGRRTPSSEQLRHWADALGLGGEMRKRFMRLGWIAHMPEDAQPEFEALVRDIESMKRRLSRLDGE